MEIRLSFSLYYIWACSVSIKPVFHLACHFSGFSKWADLPTSCSCQSLIACWCLLGHLSHLAWLYSPCYLPSVCGYISYLYLGPDTRTLAVSIWRKTLHSILPSSRLSLCFGTVLQCLDLTELISCLSWSTFCLDISRAISATFQTSQRAKGRHFFSRSFFVISVLANLRLAASSF